MYNRKPSLWLLTSVILMLVGGFALPGATARSAWTPPPPDATAWTMAPQALTASTAPISIEIDEEGYTTWTYDYSYDREALPDFCWPYSRIAWDFDLGTQDPTELSETTLSIAFAQMHFVLDENGPRTTDPTWGVALNGFPTAAYQEAIALESGFPMEGWNIIGAIGAAPQPSRQAPRVIVEQEIPFDFSNLVDGDNRIHFRQSDFCPLPELWDSACTCFEIFSIKLRARIKLGISEMSPPPDARNVRVNQHQNSEIRIKFTTYVSPTTVNAETFQVFYYDQDLNQVVVDGSVSQLSDMEFVFTPAQALKDGIRYEVQVWDWDEARRHGRDQWVTDLANGPLENGSIWSFWTLPNLQVHLVPVQVLQDTPLIVNKATALRTFIRWEAHPNVFALDQLEEIEVYDLTLRWRVLGGGQQGRVGWRDSKYGWNLPYSSQNALRKREYLTFNTSADSYDKFERMAGRDSLTYFDFRPFDSGTYDLLALVTLLDQKGEPNIHVGASITAESLASRRLNLHYRAVAVGADYGATGTRNLSESLLDSGNVTRALLPVPSITRAATPGAMPYYHPTTSLWIGDWVAPPSWPYYRQIKYLLQELSMLCARSKGIHNQPCDAMIGYVPQGWLGVNGITLPDAAPWGALAQHDTTAYSNLHFVPVHELGHLFGFIEHNDALGSDEGYFVSRRRDLRSSVAALSPQTNRTINVIRDFMITEPEEVPMVHPFYKQDPYYCEQCLWIHPSRYQSLLNRFTGGLPRNIAGTQGWSANLALDTTPLLLVSGVITPATGEMVLFPWYALDPGLWTPPHPGPYEIVFVDAGGQAIAAYTHTFDVGSTLVPSDAALVQNDDGEAFFMFVIPYPAHAARVQVYRSADNALLAERVVSATPPALTLNPLASVWSGDQTLTWHTDAGTRYFALDISTDGGASWEGLAINLTTPEATLHTGSFPNTAETFIRVDATDGWHTTSVITGPFTIANPPLVSYVAPPPNSVADPALPIVAGFRDAMDASTLTTQTITLNGGPYGTVSGAVTYDALEREATFTPHAPLAHDTVYTAQVGIDVRDSAGASLPVTFTWSFTTTIDTLPPVPLAVSPGKGAQRTPPETAVVVLWDKALDPATLTPERFTLATAEGITVSGVVAYDAAAHTLIFQPAADLLTGTLYVATLHPGIADLVGNETVGDYRWSFRTGARPPSALAFTGSYADWGVDTNGDGLYEHLIIQAGVQVTATGDYVLRGVLADAQGDEIAWSHITTTLTAGTHFLSLTFDGAAIGGRGTDGPYTLAALTAHSAVTPQTRLPEIVSQQNVYRTFAYPAAHFPTPLRFGGLPDVLLLPGTAALDAFNVRDYAQHALLSSDQLSYTITLNANPRMSVTLQSSGVVRVVPEVYWEGRTTITLRASDGVHTVQDTFAAAIGWPRALYLPVVLRAYGGPVALHRNAWLTVVEDDFESSFNWSLYSSMDITNQPWREYYWAKRDCRAHSGQYSAWAYGGGEDGGAVACGAEHPQALWALMYKATPINLKYVAQAEYNAKVWTNLNAGDEVCLKVAVIDSGYCQGEYGWPVAFTHGICRSGQTNGWEDLTLDLANVPQLGNVLGEERVCLGVTFQTQYETVRPEGAYVDDVSLRLCPEGLSAHCEGASAAPPTSPALVTGNIGGYPEEIDAVALAVENDGRVHALWTGKLNPNFQNFVFYSSSPDGVTWTPYQILSTWGGREPQIAVDTMRRRTHLAYANDDGIVHHTVTNGVISAPEIVAPHQPHRSPGTPYEGGHVAWPSLAVAEESGYAYLVWRQTHFVRTAADAHSMRHITWHAYWDGATWSAPLRKINDRDTFYSSVAAAPDGQVMLAWFQQWSQSIGGPTSPGEPIVARTAYGTAPGSFPLRQATHALYPEPERDTSIHLTYSGGDETFVLVSNHLMWPGHSRAYRYVWKDGVWNAPLNVAENTTNWATPFYVGAAQNTPLIRYVYSDDWVLKTRTETNGVLSPAQNVADYLSARGYSGSAKAYFTDATGGLHLIIAGEKASVEGFYYVKP